MDAAAVFPIVFSLGLICLLAAYAWWRATIIRRTILRHLGARRVSQVNTVNGVPTPAAFRIDLLRALRDRLPELVKSVTSHGLQGLVAETNEPSVRINMASLLSYSFRSGFGSIGSISHAVGLDAVEDAPTGMVYLCRGDTFSLVLTLVEELGGKVYLQAAVLREPRAEVWARDLMRGIERWAVGHSIFRARTVKPVFEFHDDPCDLEVVPTTTASDIRLDGRIVEELDRELLAFIRHGETLDRAGVPTQRGVLLCGEPGTGKTSTCKYLRDQLPGHTFVIVESHCLGKLRQIFQLARRLAPTVVLVEDVDLVVHHRDAPHDSGPLKDLLNEMDGIQTREQVYVVLTSNSWSFIEKALADRPGRIDHIIFYDPPQPHHRRVLLETFARGLEVEVPMESLVRLTDGLTPAQIREMVKKAAVQALRRSSDSDGVGALTQEDIGTALALIKGGGLASRSRKPIGIRPLPVAVEARGGAS